MTARPVPVDDPPHGAAGATRLVTFNIRNGCAVADGRHVWWLRRGATVAAIADVAPDLVALQEVYAFQLRHLLRHLPGFAAVGIGRGPRGRGEHVPVLYRTDRFDLEGHETRWYGVRPLAPWWALDGRAGSRIATLVRLRHRATGRALGLVSTHLDPDDVDERTRSAALLARWLAEEQDRPWVIAGDLNGTADEPALAALAAAGYRDTLAHLPPAGVGAATAHAFTGSHDGKRIDYVLVPPGLEAAATILRHRPGGRLPSDHWPVVADLAPLPHPAAG